MTPLTPSTPHPLADLSVLDRFILEKSVPGQPSDRRTLFSPVDQCHSALVWLINMADVSVDIAMYAWTDLDLNVAVTAAAARGAKVRLSLDYSQFASDKEVVKLHTTLTAAGVDVSVGNSEKGGIMHLKSGVIDGSIVFTGSTNWSLSGEDLQDNSLTVFLCPFEAQRFARRFDGVHAWQKAHPKGTV